jgi:integrase
VPAFPWRRIVVPFAIAGAVVAGGWGLVAAICFLLDAAAHTFTVRSGYVFATRNGRPVEPRNVYRSFTRVATSAGLRVIRLHDARRGCATLLTAAGIAPRVIMEILGHSQISITMDVYTHVVHDTQREAISHMDRLLKRQLPAG